MPSGLVVPGCINPSLFTEQHPFWAAIEIYSLTTRFGDVHQSKDISGMLTSTEGGCHVQNLTLAFGSILCLALPAVFGWIPLWQAVALHEGCTLLVALNSLKVLVFSRQKW